MGSELSVKIDLTIQWANSKRALDELRHNFWRYVEEMLKVQDSGSWQVEYASWNDFLESEIGWKSSYWHYLSQAYKTRAGLPASTIVDSESHLREISKAPKEKHADVVKSAQTAAKKAGRKPKASDYKKAVEATREPGDEMDVPERWDGAMWIHSENSVRPPSVASIICRVDHPRILCARKRKVSIDVDLIVRSRPAGLRVGAYSSLL